jgi:hypothetical protein
VSVQPPAVVFVPLPPGSVPCPRCHEVLSPAQDWCLNCGDPARTVIAPTPRWRWPLALLATIAALSLGVLAAAFVGLSADDPPPSKTTTTIVTTQAAPAPATTPAATTPAAAKTKSTKSTTTTTPGTTSTTAPGGDAAPSQP